VIQALWDMERRSRPSQRPDLLCNEIDHVVAALENTFDDDEGFSPDDVTLCFVEIRKDDDIAQAMLVFQ
jgi:hypothetical protein